jgi:hypothetical protein
VPKSREAKELRKVHQEVPADAGVLLNDDAEHRAGANVDVETIEANAEEIREDLRHDGGRNPLHLIAEPQASRASRESRSASSIWSA